MLQRAYECSGSIATVLLAVLLVLHGPTAGGSLCDMNSEIGSAFSPLGGTSPPRVVAEDDQVIGFEAGAVTLSFWIHNADPPVRGQEPRWFYSQTQDSVCCEGLEEITNLTSRNHVSEFVFSELTSGNGSYHVSIMVSNITRSGSSEATDVGKYFLVACNSAGYDYAFTELLIAVAASITSGPLDTATFVNEVISLSCTATGVPQPHIVWYIEIGNGTRRKLQEEVGEIEVSLESQSSAVYSCVSTLSIRNGRVFDSGNYTCTAANGFAVQESTAKVVVAPGRRPMLLFAADSLWQVRLDGTFLTPITSSNTSVNAVDFDYRQDLLFWYDYQVKSIFQARLNGTDASILINSGLTQIEGLAYDWISGNLYWTDAGAGEIGLCDIASGTTMTLIETGVGSRLRGIVTDPTTRYLYWTDWGQLAKIERASMDGKERVILHSKNLVWPNAITLDYELQVLYWIDAYLDRIESSKTDGSSRKVLTHIPNTHAYAVIFGQEALYWTNGLSSSIQKTKINAKNYKTEVFLDFLTSFPSGIRIVAEEQQPSADNPCAGSHCDHLCLLSAVSVGGFSCACTNGLALAPDGLSCVMEVAPVIINPSGNDIIVTTQGRMLTANCTATGIPAPEIAWLRNGVKLTSGIGEPQIDTAQAPFHNTSVYFVSRTLQLNDTMSTDSGNYTCIATVGSNHDSRNIQLVIRAPPHVVAADDQVIGIEAGAVTLSFWIHNANPLVRGQGLRWFYSQTQDSVCCEGLEEITNITSRNRVSEFVFLGPDDSKDAQASLIISNVTFGRRLIQSDIGRYFLMAVNPIGSHYAYTDLYIYGIPRITFPPQDATVINTASSVSFQCTVFAFPNHTTKWIFTSFSGDTTFIIATDRNDKYAINTYQQPASFSRLTVFDVKFEDRGMYNCSTFNSLGQDSASAVLTVHVPPGPVERIRVTSMPPNSILLQWELPSFTTGPISSYKLILRDNNEVTLVNATQQESNATLTNLMPLIPFTVTVSAVNIAGEGKSKLTPVFSQEGIPSASPNGVAGGRLNGSHLTVSWSPLSLEEARGFITLYTVSYQPTAGQSKRQVMSVTAQSDESSAVIGGLTVSQAYSVSVSGSTSVGMGPMSSSVTVPTTSNQLFQLVWIGVQDCSQWVLLTENTHNLEKRLTTALVEEVEQECQCGFSSEHITEQGFQCLGDSDYITFRARIYEANTVTTSRLIAIIEEWMSSGPEISIQGVSLEIGTSCPIAITSVNDPGCKISRSNTMVIALEVGIIGGSVLLLLATAAAVIVTTVYCKRKRKNNSGVEGSPAIVVHNTLALELNEIHYEVPAELITPTTGTSPIYYELQHPADYSVPVPLDLQSRHI